MCGLPHSHPVASVGVPHGLREGVRPLPFLFPQCYNISVERFFSYFNFKLFFKNFNLSPGLLFAGLLFVFVLIYGLSVGRTRAVFSFLGIYIAYAIYSVFPFWDKLDEIIKFSPQPYFTRIGFFLISYLLIFLVLNVSLVKNRLTIGEASFFAVGVISILQLGLLTAIILNMLPVAALAQFLPAYLAQYFITPPAMFYWFVVPIPALLLARRNKEKD